MAPTAIPALIAFGNFSLVGALERLLLATDRSWAGRALYAAAWCAFLTQNGEGTAYGPLMAAATIVITPLVLAFLLAQRRFIEGITFTGIKG